MTKLKIALLYIFLSLYFTINCQNNTKKIEKRIFISKKHFSKKYLAKDSIGFMVREGDTLIGVRNYIAPEGVAIPYEFKDSSFLSLYKKIAFKEIHKDSNDSKPMRYWKRPIKIYYSNSISKKSIKKLMALTKILSKEIDSLNIYRVKKIEDSNYIIYATGDYEYCPKLKNYNHSMNYMYWNRKNQIYQSYIKINKSTLFSQKLEIQKIKTLFIKSLGWFALSDELSCESYFSNCYSDNKHLTALDLELLKYHYSYGICKGTTRRTFEIQHQQCKERLKKGENPGMFIHKN